MNMKTLTNFLLIFFTCVLVSNATASVEQQRRETGTSLHTNPTTISPAVASVYLIDGSVNDIEHLTQHMTSPFYILDTDQPALAQWQAISLRHPEATHWHIVSHGHPGQLRIGNEMWDQAWLQQTESQLSLLKSQLAKGTSLSLYACDLAKGVAGKAFVQTLSNHLGANIAASTNKTGVIDGADTILEYHAAPQANTSHSHQLSFTGYRYTLSLTDLADYANGNITKEPDITTYHNADPAFTVMEQRHVDPMNDALKDGPITTLSEMIIALNKVLLLDYANGNTTNEPDITTYHEAGFTDVEQPLISLVNPALQFAAPQDFTALQAAIDAYLKLDTYTLSNPVDPDLTPAPIDYSDLGVTGVNDEILPYVNSTLQSAGGTPHSRTDDYYFPKAFMTVPNVSTTSNGLLGNIGALADDGSMFAAGSGVGRVYIFARGGIGWELVHEITGRRYFGMSSDGRKIVRGDNDKITTHTVELDSSGNPIWSSWKTPVEWVHRFSWDDRTDKDGFGPGGCVLALMVALCLCGLLLATVCTMAPSVSIKAMMMVRGL